MPTLKDIAQATGYSVGTVSQLLHTEDSRYTEKTRQLVRETAEKMGYRPDHHARTLKKGSSGIIAVLSFWSNQKGLERVAHILDALETHPGLKEFRALANSMISTPERCRVVVEMVRDLRVDALVLQGFPHWAPQELLTSLESAPFPILAVDGIGVRNRPRIRTDSSGGMRALTETLLRYGYRDLLLMPGGRNRPPEARQPDSSHPGALVEGFNAATAQDDPQARTRIWQRGAVVEAVSPMESDYLKGHANMRALIQKGDLPEAVLCHNDEWAIGAMAACHEHGLRVPDDIALTGFDNTTGGRFNPVPLTTVAHPLVKMGESVAEAVHALTSRGARQRDDPTDTVIGPCEVILRRSCPEKSPSPTSNTQ